MVKRIPKKI